MSNLSQFFAAGGNKIKKIQRVQATQILSGNISEPPYTQVYAWSYSASISAVDVNKTILVYNTNASNEKIHGYGTNSQGPVLTQYNHYPFLQNSTTISFSGPNSFPTGGVYIPEPARLDVQIIEFE